METTHMIKSWHD